MRSKTPALLVTLLTVLTMTFAAVAPMALAGADQASKILEEATKAAQKSADHAAKECEKAAEEADKHGPESAKPDPDKVAKAQEKCDEAQAQADADAAYLASLTTSGPSDSPPPSGSAPAQSSPAAAGPAPQSSSSSSITTSGVDGYVDPNCASNTKKYYEFYFEYGTKSGGSFVDSGHSDYVAKWCGGNEANRSAIPQLDAIALHVSCSDGFMENNDPGLPEKSTLDHGHTHVNPSTWYIKKVEIDTKTGAVKKEEICGNPPSAQKKLTLTASVTCPTPGKPAVDWSVTSQNLNGQTVTLKVDGSNADSKVISGDAASGSVAWGGNATGTATATAGGVTSNTVNLTYDSSTCVAKTLSLTASVTCPTPGSPVVSWSTSSTGLDGQTVRVDVTPSNRFGTTTISGNSASGTIPWDGAAGGTAKASAGGITSNTVNLTYDSSTCTAKTLSLTASVTCPTLGSPVVAWSIGSTGLNGQTVRLTVSPTGSDSRVINSGGTASGTVAWGGYSSGSATATVGSVSSNTVALTYNAANCTPKTLDLTASVTCPTAGNPVVAWSLTSTGLNGQTVNVSVSPSGSATATISSSGTASGTITWGGAGSGSVTATVGSTSDTESLTYNSADCVKKALNLTASVVCPSAGNPVVAWSVTSTGLSGRTLNISVNPSGGANTTIPGSGNASGTIPWGGSPSGFANASAGGLSDSAALTYDASDCPPEVEGSLTLAGSVVCTDGAPRATWLVTGENVGNTVTVHLDGTSTTATLAGGSASGSFAYPAGATHTLTATAGGITKTVSLTYTDAQRAACGDTSNPSLTVSGTVVCVDDAARLIWFVSANDIADGTSVSVNLAAGGSDTGTLSNGTASGSLPWPDGVTTSTLTATAGGVTATAPVDLTAVCGQQFEREPELNLEAEAICVNDVPTSVTYEVTSKDIEGEATVTIVDHQSVSFPIGESVTGSLPWPKGERGPVTVRVTAGDLTDTQVVDLPDDCDIVLDEVVEREPLPRTGSNMMSLLLAALMFGIAGFGSLSLARRRGRDAAA